MDELFSEIDNEYSNDSKINYTADLRYNQESHSSGLRNPIKRKVPVKQISLILVTIALVAFIIINFKNVSSSPVREAISENKHIQVQKKIAEYDVDEAANDLTKVSTGYYDNDLKIVYFQNNKGTYSIQESSWNNKIKANKRASYVSKITGDNNVNISEFNNDGILIYRVMLDGFESLELAKSKAKEIRELIKY